MLLYRLFVALFLAIGWGILSAGLSPSVGLEYLGRRVGRGLGASEAPSANEARLLLVGSLPLPDPASTSFLVFSSEKLGLLAGCFDEVDAAAGWVTVSRRQLQPDDSSSSSSLAVASLEKLRHFGNCFEDDTTGWTSVSEGRVPPMGLMFGSMSWSSKPGADCISRSVSGLPSAWVRTWMAVTVSAVGCTRG